MQHRTVAWYNFDGLTQIADYYSSRSESITPSVRPIPSLQSHGASGYYMTGTRKAVRTQLDHYRWRPLAETSFQSTQSGIGLTGHAHSSTSTDRGGVETQHVTYLIFDLLLL